MFHTLIPHRSVRLRANSSDLHDPTWPCVTLRDPPWPYGITHLEGHTGSRDEISGSWPQSTYELSSIIILTLWNGTEHLTLLGAYFSFYQHTNKMLVCHKDLLLDCEVALGWLHFPDAVLMSTAELHWIAEVFLIKCSVSACFQQCRVGKNESVFSSHFSSCGMQISSSKGWDYPTLHAASISVVPSGCLWIYFVYTIQKDESVS